MKILNTKLLNKLCAGAILCFFSIAANAYIVSDVIHFNKKLRFKETYTLNFDLQEHGYDHNRDVVSLVTLTLDFTEIKNDGDETPETREFIQILSYFFNRIDTFPDVDTGKIYLQKVPEPWEDLSFINLALASYTFNLKLKTATLEAEIAPSLVPEPAPFILFGAGFLAVACMRRKRLVSEN